MGVLDKPLIRAISFEPDGVIIEYCVPTKDARANGVTHNHTLFVPASDQYEEEIDAVNAAAVALIEDVLEDLPNLEPLRLPVNGVDRDADDDEDDDDDDE